MQPLPAAPLSPADEVARAAALLLPPGAVVELRAPKTRYRAGASATHTAAGYFDDPVKLAEAALGIEALTPGVYVTLNPVLPALLARSANAIGKAEHQTADGDVVRRWWLLVDLDPTRPAGISATDDEKAVAYQAAQAAADALAWLGWPEPVWADSGNGYHLLYPVDLPNDDDSRELCRRVLVAMAERFDQPGAKVDRSVFNSGRIVKLYGTLSRKGSDLPDRPHRRSRLLQVPETLAPVPVSLLEDLATEAPAETKPGKPAPAAEVPVGTQAFDVPAFLARHGLQVHREGAWKGNGYRWTLTACPFTEHSAPGKAFVGLQPSGAIVAGCVSGNCNGWGWHDLRAHFEPKPSPAAPSPVAPADWSAAAEAADVAMPTNSHELSQRYVILVGSDLAWDLVKRQTVSIPALKHGHAAYVNDWLKSPNRKRADVDALVFEPAGAKPGQINIFRGLDLQPDPSAPCAGLVGHIAYLCNNDPELTHWVTCWLAYPLQHPGAKLQTALVVRGSQGTGKNLFFERAVGSIYAPYAVTIGQREIESPYTGWLSGRLWVVADEVLSRAERAHAKNRLKGLITGETVVVEEKYKSPRIEANHANLVFLSNEDVPVLLDADDRRFTVLEVLRPQPADYYTGLAAELAGGGAAGLYAYLLAYDLQGWGPHTKPPATEAKVKLQQASEPAAATFLREWAEDGLPVPYCAATADDLFEAYRIYCERAGESRWAIESRTAFGRRMVKHLWRERKLISDGRRAICYSPDGQFSLERIATFRAALDGWLETARARRL